jgi:hypothetical protein
MTVMVPGMTVRVASRLRGNDKGKRSRVKPGMTVKGDGTMKNNVLFPSKN